MQLYTSLVRLKQAMNGGQMPAMTPLSDQALKILDPAFTIGMGALEEDFERGLRCPVRECGQYFHSLRAHLRRSHQRIGGPDAILRALSIPPTAVLASSRLRARRVALAQASNCGERLRAWVAANPGISRANVVKATRSGVSGKARARSMNTVGVKNLQNRCVAQLSHKIIDLHNALRRTPSSTEFAKHYDPSTANAVLAAFGTWANAIAQCGLVRARRMHWTRADVIESFRAWYEEHGTLPSSGYANSRTSTPIIPCVDVVIRVFEVERWSQAMEIIASILDVHGGRYGLPERKEVA